MLLLEVYYISSILKMLSTRRGVSGYKTIFVPNSVQIAQGALMVICITTICTDLKHKIGSSGHILEIFL